MDFPARCIDLTSAHVAEAMASKDAMGELLVHLARVAKAGEGAAKILVPIARMATTECDWLEGGLTVTVSGSNKTCTILVAVDLGVGLRELLFPRLRLDVPREEILRAVKAAPALVHPLMPFFEKDALVLSCDAAAVGTMPPPAFEIAEASIRRSLPAPVRRSLPPLYSDLANLKVDIPDLGELDLLGALPKREALPKIDDLSDVDEGWGGAAPSKPPRAASKRPPAAASAAAAKPMVRRPVKIVKKAAAAPPPARPSKTPPRKR